MIQLCNSIDNVKSLCNIVTYTRGMGEYSIVSCNNMDNGHGTLAMVAVEKGLNKNLPSYEKRLMYGRQLEACRAVTGYLLVLHLLVVQALVPLPCGQMLVGQKLVVTIACEVICLQYSLLVRNMLVAVICL